ncbi:MAG: HEPN domain-containing protein [Desulfobacterales bacterium]|nr:HEPN domain-containing protein [Desulfobacterales bacterium]
MKQDDTRELVRHRIEQALTALEDARFLLDGKRSPQSIVNRAYYAMFYAALALLQSISKVPSRVNRIVRFCSK